jgi:hypothetical protein
LSHPERRIKDDAGACSCARTASGYATAVPPNSVMNSRRFSWSNCIGPCQQVALQDIGLTRSSQRHAGMPDWSVRVTFPCLINSSMVLGPGMAMSNEAPASIFFIDTAITAQSV